MFTSARLARLFVSGLLLATFAASAQTAPQLLPYTTNPIAGGGTAAIAKGATCPVSGYTSLDAYGDGCLATEVLLGTSASAPGPRDAIADASGNVYFGDYANGLVHRVDAITGIMSLVAGGPASSPGANAPCGTGLSTDARGDGCLATFVHLSHPTGLVFDPAGNLYFADYGYGEVRQVTAQNGSVGAVTITAGGSGYVTAPTVTFSAPPTGGTLPTATATISGGAVVSVTMVTYGSGYTAPPTVTFSAPPTGATASGVASPTGTISLIAGSTSGTGYVISNATATVTAAQSQLAGPYSLAFDNQGDLFIADEYDASIDVLNTNASGTNTVNGVAVPAGTIWKIAGTLTTGGPYCSTGLTSSSGCTYNHAYTEGLQANSDWVRNAYGLAVDSLGNTYITQEYYDTIVQVNPAGKLTTVIGTNNSGGSTTARGVAPNIKIGSPFGVAVDTANNIYFTDAADGTIWRVDSGSNDQYVIASGFGFSNSGGFASTSLPGPGVFGISVDKYEDLFFADTEKNVVTEIASGTQFGPVGAGQPTQTVEVHFASGDGPAATNPYVITVGANNFSLGTPTLLAKNADGTSDYLLPITATPGVLGPFTGTLQVTAQVGGAATFPLSGTYIQSPVTRTAVTYTAGVTCSGTTTYATTTPISITATVTANGPNPPVGAADTITFFANNGSGATQIGSPVAVSNIGTSTNPVYGATLSYTFSTPGTYTLTATYSGDSYFKLSTGKAAATVSTATAAFTTAATAYSYPSVVAGETALYSFNIVQTVYTGTFTFACSGLPGGAACVFNPATITANGCSTTSTIALSITTTPPPTVQSGLGFAGRGPWTLLGALPCLALALLLGLRRGRTRFGQLAIMLALLFAATSGLVACGNGVTGPARTPAGSYTIGVTTTSSTGGTSSFNVPLTVQ